MRLVGDGAQRPQRVASGISRTARAGHLGADEVAEPHARRRRTAHLAERSPGLIVDGDARDTSADGSSAALGAWLGWRRWAA